MSVHQCTRLKVALFTRAWIEITAAARLPDGLLVALFTRAWIEITAVCGYMDMVGVALFTRAWIEITKDGATVVVSNGRPLHEGVD